MHIETAGEGTYALFSMDGVDIVGNDMRLTVMHLLNSADRI